MFVCICMYECVYVMYVRVYKILFLTCYLTDLVRSLEQIELKAQKTEAISYTQLHALLNYEGKQDLATSTTP